MIYDFTLFGTLQIAPATSNDGGPMLQQILPLVALSLDFEHVGEMVAFVFQAFRIAELEDFKIARFKDFRMSEFEDFRIWDIQDFSISEFEDLRI